VCLKSDIVVLLFPLTSNTVGHFVVVLGMEWTHR